MVLLSLAAAVPASAYAQTPTAEDSKAEAEARLRVIEPAEEKGLDPGDPGAAMLHQAVMRDMPSSAIFMENPLRLASFRQGRLPLSDRAESGD